MKRVIFIAVFLLLGVNLFAQSDRGVLLSMKVNGEQNYLTHSCKTDRCGIRDGKYGFSVEPGFKFFPIKNTGIFIDGSAMFFYTHLPYLTLSWVPTVYWTVLGHTSIKEMGLGCSALFGYDFILNKYLSIEVFTGPILRYSTKQGPKWDTAYDNIKKEAFKWKVGAGVNFKHFNLNFSISKDMIDRGIKGSDNKIHKYKTYSISVGLAYRIPLKRK